MTGPTFMAVALAVSALATAAAWLSARAVSAALIRFRAARLPGDVAERLLEEWLAELAHMRSRARQLAFALRLLCTRRRVFVNAIHVSNPEDLRKAVELPSVRVDPTARDLGVANYIDSVLLIAPLWLLTITGWPPLTVAAAVFAWALAWAAIVHVLAMWLWHATPGELFCGLHVITVDGRPLTWRHILYRARHIPAVVLVAAVWVWLVPVSNAVWFLWIVVGIALALRRKRSRPAQLPGLRQHAFPETFTILTVKVPVVFHVPNDGPPRSTSAMR